MPRLLEFILVYFATPALFAGVVHWLRKPALLLPALWLASLLALLVLRKTPGSDPPALWQLHAEPDQWRRMVLRFTVLCLFFSWACLRNSPEGFLALPRQRPTLWLLILVAYPLLSAIPQGIVWRVLFVHRYGMLFPNPLAFYLGSAIAFAGAHMVFGNPITLIATAVGGALFMQTYRATGSALLASLEHGAYGVAAFTIGLGRYFYLRANM